MTNDLCEVIITAPDAEWLAAFTRRLVEARLAACGHNITSIRSIYRWEETIYDEGEARVALHTRLSLLDRIIAETKQQHPYDVPCVIGAPIIDGDPDYLQWVRDVTLNPERT